MENMPIRLVIFDLDGTLTDSLADLTAATNWMLRHFRRPELSPEEVRRMVGQGARRLVERALSGAPAGEVEEGLGLFLAYNELHIADRTVLYPAAEAVLARLREEGRLLAIVSNKNESLCRKLLAVLGVERHFAAVLGADSTPFRKPSPEPLLQLMRDFDVTADETIMVGDSINDVAAGREAGVVTVGCSFGYGDAEEIADADYRIDRLSELMELPFWAGRSGIIP